MNDSSPLDRADAVRQPAPGSAEKLGQLRELLREMFQLDRGDLDFGLYRIMNMKADELGKFLDDDLLPQVQEKLQGISAEDRANLENDLRDSLRAARQLGVPNPEEATRVKDLRRQLAEAQADADAEADVYGHLAGFFARYYAEGDFVSQRRYTGGGGSAYLIPYDGEEVKLHWANADQYYVKTTESYASYAFTVNGGRRVRFEISAAHTEKDNNKEAPGKQRRFVLAARNPVEARDGELIVRFDHRPLTDAEKKRHPGNGTRQQDAVNAATAERVMTADALDAAWRAQLAALAPTDANGERTVLAKHIDRYTAKNTFDYFIHKDLGGFLRRELEFYLKTEVMNLDDLALGDAGRLRRALARMRTIRFVGDKIIAFLAQLEDFQKRLWLKKKLVLETQWCVTLDRVPEEMYPEIAANEAQRKEWVELFAIDEIAGDLGNGETGYSEPLSVDFLKANPSLVLDTRHFAGDFTDRLLEHLGAASPLDDQIDGLLVHGENFQTLHLLHRRYSGQIDCVYIDPPYNTGDSEILYRNGYLRSSWLSLMENRLELVPKLLSPDPVVYIAIDDFEMVNLARLVDSMFPWLRREMIIVNHHPQGGKGKTLASTHEYMLACVRSSSDRSLAGRLSDEGVELRTFKRGGTAESNFRRGRPNSFYAILVDPESHKVVGVEPPPTGDYPTERTESNHLRVYPLGADGEERVWRRSYESCKSLIDEGKLTCSNGYSIYHRIEAKERHASLFSNWVDTRYNAGTFGANLLSDIIGVQNPFPYPKSIHTVGDAIFAAGLDDDATVLDFFAGSGTTGHAVMCLNREDGGTRKFVLADMGGQFDLVLMPRLKKIAYATSWKGGKPVLRDGGGQLFKCIRLESYEDALDCLEFRRTSSDLFADAPSLAEDYRLRYALGIETAGSASVLGRVFKDPFSYMLEVVRDGLRSETRVDLPESFNYLIGLEVETRRRLGDLLATTGVDSSGQRCLVLWRNIDEIDNAALEAWFREHRSSFGKSIDCVYVNGDQTLNAIRLADEHWTAEPIEPLFRELMFEGAP